MKKRIKSKKVGYGFFLSIKCLANSRFDNLFFSCDLGMDKPDVKVFEYVSRKTGIEGKNILFIDDSVKNIDAARELGWNVCNATGDEFDKIKETVEEFLMKD